MLYVVFVTYQKRECVLFLKPANENAVMFGYTSVSYFHTKQLLKKTKCENNVISMEEEIGEGDEIMDYN